MTRHTAEFTTLDGYAAARHAAVADGAHPRRIRLERRGVNSQWLPSYRGVALPMNVAGQRDFMRRHAISPVHTSFRLAYDL